MPRHRRIGDVEAREDVARGSLTLGEKGDDVATRGSASARRYPWFVFSTMLIS
jgi:hypothetical protein